MMPQYLKVYFAYLVYKFYQFPVLPDAPGGKGQFYFIQEYHIGGLARAVR